MACLARNQLRAAARIRHSQPWAAPSWRKCKLQLRAHPTENWLWMSTCCTYFLDSWEREKENYWRNPQLVVMFVYCQSSESPLACFLLVRLSPIQRVLEGRILAPPTRRHGSPPPSASQSQRGTEEVWEVGPCPSASSAWLSHLFGCCCGLLRPMKRKWK